MLIKRRLLLATAILAIGGATARAEPQSDRRIAFAVDVGGRTTAMSFAQSVTFEAFSEEGSLVTNYALKHSPFVDGGVTVRVWHGLGAGVAFSSLHDSFPAHITARIPHPIIANQPRTLTTDAAVTFRETATHLQAVYWFQRGWRLDAALFGGPSLFRTYQDFVSDVSYSQSFPYNSVTFEGATIARQRKSEVGWNVGGQVGWTLVGPVGLTALARYSRVVTHFSEIGIDSVAGGGLNIGAGVRLVF